MICSAQYIIDSGLPISSDISDREIEYACRTVEQFYVKPMLGSELYSDIVSDTTHQYDDIVNGTDEVAGLELAISHLVFAYLAYDNTRITRYTSVVKDSDESENPSREDLLAVAKHHWEIGMVFVREVLEFLQIEIPKSYNNMIFSELI